MFWTILLTAATGMRTMTGIAVVSWAAYLGLLPVEGTWAFWVGKLASVIVFTLLAAGEYVGDTLPKAPNRTDLPLVAARMCFAVLVGAIMATVLEQPKAGGVVLGVLGALIGTYGGFKARMAGARLVGKDLPVALAESAFALGISVLAMRHIHKEIVTNADHALKWMQR